MVENAGILENMIGNYYPNSDSRVAPISIENETKVMRNIGKMCAKAIQAFPRSFKDDFEMLDSNELTQNQRNAKTFTLHERQALMDLGQLTDWIMEALMQKPQVSIELLKGKLG